MELHFEWDLQKAALVMAERAIAFSEIARLFNAQHVILPTDRQDEIRWRIIGEIDEVCVTGVYTIRSNVIRIITARRSWPKEEREYRAFLAR